jgi:hypothetical protein
MHVRTLNAPQSRVQDPSPVARDSMPVRATVKTRPVRRMVGVALASWLVAWGCVGIVMYFQDAPTPYVLDREDD